MACCCRCAWGEGLGCACKARTWFSLSLLQSALTHHSLPLCPPPTHPPPLQVRVSLGFAGAVVLSWGLAVVVQVSPWWDPQYLIPMLGMLLGNACSGVAVGLSTILEELDTGVLAASAKTLQAGLMPDCCPPRFYWPVNACLCCPCCSCLCPRSGRDKVELLLSMGASRMEATRDVVARAARMAFTPLLNSMNVVVRAEGGGMAGALLVLGCG